MKHENSTIVGGFAANLKRIRQEKGYTLREVAANCNIDFAGISKMESGRVNVTLQTLEQLAEALEVATCDFLEC